MRKLRHVLALFILCPFTIFSQHLEVGVNGGVSSYLGDLSTDVKKVNIGELHLAAGAFLRYHHSNILTTKLAFAYGQVSADDANSNGEERRNRNLHFKSSIFETNLTMEINILGYEPKYLSKRISPYIYAGIGAFAFNPKALYENEWVELQPLHTEGQGIADFPERKPYKKMSISIPFGGGIKVAVNENINVGIEMGLRKTFTDYLDDVSTTFIADNVMIENYGLLSATLANRSGQPVDTNQIRGNPNNTDWYTMSSLTVSYNLYGSGFNLNNRKRRRGMGCPSF